jgi:tight adherence protein B
MLPIILGVIVILVVAMGVIWLRGGQGDVVDERLDQLSEFTADWAPEAGSEGDIQEQAASAFKGAAERLDRAVARRGFAQGMRAQLRRANMKLTVGEYLGLHVIAFVVAGFLGYVILGNPEQPTLRILFTAGAAFGGLFFPRLYVGVQRNRRLKALDEQLADILNLWVNALRAGYSVMQALEAIGTEAPPPASEEFRRVVMEVQIGISLEEALEHMLNRVESEDLDMVFTAVNIQREVGGNLAEILDVISHTIRERVRIKGEIRTMTAQGKLTGYILSLLPVILALLLYVLNPDYMGLLFAGPPFIGATAIACGWPIIGIGLILIGFGAAAISRIVDIEV